MYKVLKDSKYGFGSIFNMSTGEYIRGIDVDDDPFMAEYPHLIDVGVMGHCEHGKSGLCVKAGVKCYQNGLTRDDPNMTLEDYTRIIKESKDYLFEIALGGAGDPDMHENFEEILRVTRAANIIPNFTTSGLGMTPEKARLCKELCGAVAVSMYSRLKDIVPDLAYRRVEGGEPWRIYENEDDIPVRFTFGNDFDKSCYWDAPFYMIDDKEYNWDELHHMYYGDTKQYYEFYRVFNEAPEVNYTMNAIKMLLDAGVKTNIHYVLSNTTIDEALIRLKYNGFPKGINAVVFLLHKPVGLGKEDDVLDVNNPKVEEFFKLIDKAHFPFKVGFDSCSIPGILKWSNHIDPCSIDTCEGSRFSMYITPDMVALPCSFDNQDKKYAVSLKDGVTIKDAWESKEFEKFRNILRNSCKGCSKRNLCMGGCPLQKGIVLCNDEEFLKDGVASEG